MIYNNKRNYQKIFFLAVCIVLLTATTFYFFPSTSPLRAPVTEGELAAQDKKVSGEDIPNIEEIAEFNRHLAATVKYGMWEHEHLENIAKLWRTFDSGQRSEIQQYRIFEQFNDAITGQILVQRTRSQRNDIIAIYQERALIDVAKQLGIKYKENKKQQSAQTSKIVSNENSETSDELLTREELEQASLEDQQKILRQLASLNEGAGRTSNNGNSVVENQQSIKITKEPGRSINLSSTDANQLMKQFVSAYKDGNLNMMKDLFLSSSNATEVDSAYRDLFLQTKNRELEFKTASWSQGDGKIIGSINYTLSLQKKQDNQTLKEIGNIDVVVNQQQGEPKIARLEFKNSIVGSVKSSSKQVASAQSSSRKNSVIDEQALKSIVSDFANAYRQGDLRKFMAFFSKNAKADDKTTLEGIKQDYRELFSTTEFREMSIDDLDWKISGKTAMGKGKLRVKIKNKSQGFPVSVFGEIEFRIENIDGKLLIRSILHNV